MTILIIEDEEPAARRLQQMILRLSPESKVLDVLNSVEASVHWFKKKSKPDIVFMDIHLSDGLSFDILEQVEISSPVIFTTAYDEYAIQAFTLNSIDYLLKPIEESALSRSILKYQNWSARSAGIGSQPEFRELIQTLQLREKTYKNRFLVSAADRLLTIPVDDIAYFTAEDKAVLLVIHDGSRFIIEFSLDRLEGLLNPGRFFRLNRQFLAAIPAISKIHQHFNGKLKIDLKPADTKEILVSREKVNQFKQWLDT